MQKTSFFILLMLSASAVSQENQLIPSRQIQSSGRSRVVPDVASLTSLDIQSPVGFVDRVANGEYAIVPDVGLFWFDFGSTKPPNGDTVVDGGTLNGGSGNWHRDYVATETFTTAQLSDPDVFWLPTGKRVIVYDTTAGGYRSAVGNGAAAAVTLTDDVSGAGGGADDQNLGYTASPADGTVTIVDGTDAVIPINNATNAGLERPHGPASPAAAGTITLGDTSSYVLSVAGVYDTISGGDATWDREQITIHVPSTTSLHGSGNIQLSGDQGWIDNPTGGTNVTLQYDHAETHWEEVSRTKL